MYIFASVLAVSAISIIGIFFIFLKTNRLKDITFTLVGVSVGSLLGGAFFHLLPEIFTAGSNSNLEVSSAILLGIFTFFTLEKIIHWRHTHKIHSLNEASCEGCDESQAHIGYMILFSDALHNILDGALIAIAFMVSIPAGIATTIAVMLHEIPQEIADFGVLLHAGLSKVKALMYNFLSAITAFWGAGLVLVYNDIIDKYINIFTAFAAGSLMYIAMADLVPELHKKNKGVYIFTQILSVSVGIFIMFMLTKLD